jgi:hypothetical protein
MAKSRRKDRRLTTDEALERLLGNKAAKRLRQLAMRVAKEEREQQRESKEKSKKKR